MSLIWRLVAVAALVLWASTGRAVDRYVVEVTNTFASITFGYCETLGGSTWECLRQVVEQRNATHPESGPHHFGDISNCGNLLSSTVGASCTAIFYNAPGAAVPNGANTVKFWTRAVEPFAPAGGGGGVETHSGKLSGMKNENPRTTAGGSVPDHATAEIAVPIAAVKASVRVANTVTPKVSDRSRVQTTS